MNEGENTAEERRGKEEAGARAVQTGLTGREISHGAHKGHKGHVISISNKRKAQGIWERAQRQGPPSVPSFTLLLLSISRIGIRGKYYDYYQIGDGR